MKLNSDKINLSIGEADFLFNDNTPLVSVEEHTVFPIDRLPKGFLLEGKMPVGIYERTEWHRSRIKNKFKKGHIRWDKGKGGCLNTGKTHFKKGNTPWNKGKGGKSKTRQGYICIYKPTHPFCNSHKYVLEHRLVIEKHLGRYLKPTEIAHHRNEIKTDNRPKNLMAFISHSAHGRFERGGKVKKSEIVFDGRKMK